MSKGSNGSAIVLVCWLLGTSLSIQAAVIDCDQCAADDYVQKARDAGVGDHLVYDLASATLKQFAVDCEGVEFHRASAEEAQAAPDVAALHRAEIERAQTITAACAQPLQVKPVAPVSSVRKPFESALSFYRLAGNSTTLTIALVMGDFPDARENIRDSSARDHAADHNLRAMTGNWLRETRHALLAEPARSVMSALTDDLLGGMFDSGLHVRFEVSLLDGSRVAYDWDLHAEKIAWVPGAAGDAT